MELILLVNARDPDGRESAQQIIQYHYRDPDQKVMLPKP